MTNLLNFASDGKIQCPHCSEAVATRWEREEFIYGVGDSATKLTVSVPVRKCVRCDFDFTDSVADDIRHAAVCKHRGLLAPAEITAIRERYSLSRMQFAKVTGVGEASINRWENGLKVQNAAMDNYIYLLSFHENLERIQRRGSGATSVKTQPVGSGVARTFRCLKVTQEMRERQGSFGTPMARVSA